MFVEVIFFFIFVISLYFAIKGEELRQKQELQDDEDFTRTSFGSSARGMFCNLLFVISIYSVFVLFQLIYMTITYVSANAERDRLQEHVD